MLTWPGEIVTDVQKIDPDWWLVTNAQGQVGFWRFKLGNTR